MGKETLSEKMTSLIGEMTYDHLPPKVINKAKYCILDLFGAYFAGCHLRSCDPIKKYVQSLHAPEQSRVWSMK